MTELPKALGGLVERLVEALEPGQRNGGHFVFQVRVNGMGARPLSPRAVARELCLLWQGASQEEYGSDFTVTVEEPLALKELEAVMRKSQRAERDA